MLMVYEISEAGTVNAPIDPQNKLIQEALAKVKEHYQKEGFKRPWVSFLAFEKGPCVGYCGFKSAPKEDGRLEIFFYPFPGKESAIVATDMVRRLVEMTNFHDKKAIVTFCTSSSDDQTAKILKSLEFTVKGPLDTPQGQVWEWNFGWKGHVRFEHIAKN